MSAWKTGLPEYRQGESRVYAGKITAVEPFDMAGLPGCAKLRFGDLDKEANVQPYWVNEEQPQVGGYFVVIDLPSGRPTAFYLPAHEFERRYVRA